MAPVVRFDLNNKFYYVGYNEVEKMIEVAEITTLKEGEREIERVDSYVIRRGNDKKESSLSARKSKNDPNSSFTLTRTRSGERLPLFGSINKIEQEAIAIIMNLYLQVKDDETRSQLKTLLDKAQKLAMWGLIKNEY